MGERPGRAPRWLQRGYLLVVDRNGLRIEVTDYHAEPLQLDWDELAALGLTSTRPLSPSAPRDREPG